MRKKPPVKGHARRKAGKLFIISAPSGTGKTTLCRKLLSEGLGLLHSVSATTRRPRQGEKDGKDYHFLSREDFEAMITRDEFLEHEDNFGELYGTPRAFIEKALEKREAVILSIDVKGAMKVKRAYPKESTLIFIVPPSIEALKKRLKSRSADDPETMAARLKLAKSELPYKDRYDYSVINDRLDSAYRKLKNIIVSEIGN